MGPWPPPEQRSAVLPSALIELLSAVRSFSSAIIGVCCENPGIILSPGYGLAKEPGRSQEASATRDLNSAISLSITSAGVFQPSV